MNQLFTLLFALFLFQPAYAHRTEQGFMVIDPEHKALREFSQNPEVVIDHVSKLGFEIYGPAGLEQALIAKKIQYTQMLPVSAKMGADYPTPEAIIKKMQSLQKQFPKIISLIQIGTSVEGRPLMFAKLTAPAKSGIKAPSARPEFKYVANMHGDEIVGRELMVKLIEDLAMNYGKENRITQLLDTVQIYIMPSMNPDGAIKRQRGNANNVDLNRSFPDFTTSDNQNTQANREPEIQAMMKFQSQHKFVFSANFHGGAEVVNYPYDTKGDVFPLDNLVKNISLNYSRKIPYFWNSTEFEHGITNGYDWYEVDGGMQDWSYHWHGDLQLTIELTQKKWPAFSTVDRYYQDNRDSLIGYIEEIVNL
jgi:hypothetical protein